ncbi:MAG: efflux RND transporter periplasmic adaptor subunit [Pseudomonadota bacterium]
MRLPLLSSLSKISVNRNIPVISRLSGSVLTALTILLLSVLWLALGPSNERGGGPQQVRERQVMKVEVHDSQEVDYQAILHITGKTEPVSQVTVRSKISGVVEVIDIEEGQNVLKDSPLVWLSAEDRPAQLSRARATVEQRRIDLQSTEKLAQEGYRTQQNLLAAQAAYDAALADLRRAELAAQDRKVLAPTDGLIAKRHVELGQYINTSAPIADIVDNTSLRITGFVNERYVGKIRLGSPVTVRLVDGNAYDAIVSYVSPLAQDATRTFEIEVIIDNAQGNLIGGLTARMSVSLDPVRAHEITASTLTLDTRGRIGIMSVDPGDQVVFYPVTIIGEEAEKVWITGLPQRLQIITKGQGFVTDSETVEAVQAS